MLSTNPELQVLRVLQRARQPAGRSALCSIPCAPHSATARRATHLDARHLAVGAQLLPIVTRQAGGVVQHVR